MTFPQQHLEEHSYTHASDVSIIRREFVELTGNLFSAVILNQLLYWTLRVKDFDYLLEEEKRFQPNCNVSPRHGWIYKTAPELNEETMLRLSPPSIRKYLKLLIDEGWIDEREHPTERWNKTTQYRVNVRRLQEDLDHQGHSLPEVYLKAFRGTFQRKPLTQQNISENLEETADEKNFSSNQRNFVSSENSDDSSGEEPHSPKENLNQRIFGSNEKIFASKERNFASNQKFFASNTETTSKNTNKEKLATHARAGEPDSEESVLEKFISEKLALEEPVPEKSVSEEFTQDGSLGDMSVAAEMLKLWEYHVVQNLPPLLVEARNVREDLRLTKKRTDKLESLFAFHFQNDMRLWERFCLRVKASNFLMGGGARKWVVRLDWLFREGKVSKILEGKFDNSNRPEQADVCDRTLEKVQANPALTAEKAAIVSSIKDPIWRKWCSRLAEGVRFNDHKMLHEPLSLIDLQHIANAHFLECEDERLVWIGSSDPGVLNAIENLRLQISWVYAKKYPKARTIRTRLDSETFHLNAHHTLKGEKYA